MNQKLLLRTVLLRLGRYKVKTVFMALGIAISVLAAVLLPTAAGSIQEAFLAFINNAYPADGLVLAGGAGFMGQAAGSGTVRMEDVEAVVNSIGEIVDHDPFVNGGYQYIKHEGFILTVRIAGFSERAEVVRRRSVTDGEFFTAEEVERRAKVALIGSKIVDSLFPDESPLGAQIYIDNVPFEVKGVLEDVGADPHGKDQDHFIQVPYTTLMDTILRVSYLTGATFLVEDRNRVPAVAEEIAQILRERHRIQEGEEDDFNVFTSGFVLDLFNQSFKTVSIFVPLITGTAFLVSAIVILSIMQISIKERTPEIGLRKALGARSRDVETQVVLEVLIIAAAASTVGVVLAYVGCTALTSYMVARFGVTDLSPPLVVMITAVVAAVLTGLLGAVLPARRAARLDPVAALR